MIQITPQMRIWLAGALVVFSSRRRKALKCLVFDVQGFWLCQKRLSTGRFAWWPTDAKPPTFGLDAHQLQALLWNAKPASAQAVPLWRPITPAGWRNLPQLGGAFARKFKW